MKINEKITPENFPEYEAKANAALGGEKDEAEYAVRCGIASFRETYAGSVTEEDLKANIRSTLEGKTVAEQYRTCFSYCVAMTEMAVSVDESAGEELKNEILTYRKTYEVLNVLGEEDVSAVCSVEKLEEDIDEMIELLTEDAVYSAVLFSGTSNYVELCENIAGSELKEIPILVSANEDTIARYALTMYGLQKSKVITSADLTAEEYGVLAAGAFAADEAEKLSDDPVPVLKRISRVLRVLIPYAKIAAVAVLFGIIIKPMIGCFFAAILLSIRLNADNAKEKFEEMAEKLKVTGIKVYCKSKEFITAQINRTKVWMQAEVLPKVREVREKVGSFLTNRVVVPVCSFVMDAKNAVNSTWEKISQKCKDAVEFLVKRAKDYGETVTVGVKNYHAEADEEEADEEEADEEEVDEEEVDEEADEEEVDEEEVDEEEVDEEADEEEVDEEE